MADLPKYLQTTKSRGITYYRYLMRDGSYESLGKDRASAIRQATALNQIRARKDAESDAPVTGSGMRVRTALDEFEPVKLRNVESEATRRELRRKFRRYREWMGDWAVAKVSVGHLDKLLEVKVPKSDPYRLHRLLIGEFFTYCIGKGWRSESAGNPGKALLPPKLARPKMRKQRTRITEVQFSAIRECAPPWLQIAMDLAYYIGIRRGDVCNLLADAFDGECLRFIPSKTADLPDPVALQITLTPELKDLVARSQDLAPRSPFFIHKNNPHRGGEPSVDRKHRTQVLPEQLSRAFTVARSKAEPEVFKGLTVEQLPTYHEIRSLCARRYRAMGWNEERIQLLLGHATLEMTQLYLQDAQSVHWAVVDITS